MPTDFSQVEHQIIFEVWQVALEQDEENPSSYLLTHLDPVTYQQVQGWLNKPLYAILRGISPSEGEIRHEKLVEEVTQGLLKLRYRRLKDRLQEIQYMMAEFDNGGDAYSAEQHGGNIVLVLNAALAGITRAQARHSLAGKRAAAEAQARMQTQSMD